MRNDMSKVCHERERAGSSDGRYTARSERRAAKQMLRIDDDFIVNRRGMKSHLKGHYSNLKETDANYRPLYRWLCKQIGRPWDMVYSEFCENFAKENPVINYDREFFKSVVEQNIRMIDGKPYVANMYVSYHWANGGKGNWIPYPCSNRNSMWQSMYVNPETGLLCLAPVYNIESYYHKKDMELQNKHYSPKDRPLVQYWRIKGVWYEVNFREPTKEEIKQKNFGRWENDYCSFNKKPTRTWTGVKEIFSEPKEFCSMAAMSSYDNYWTWDMYKRCFGRHILPISKRQMNTKEIRRMEAEKIKAEKADRIRRAA